MFGFFLNLHSNQNLNITISQNAPSSSKTRRKKHDKEELPDDE